MYELGLIDVPEALDELVARLQGARRLAIDTEFVRESTYYPQLCLLQVASDDTIGGIDCLADLDLAPLFDLLYDPARQWILHSARQDLEVLWNATSRLPATIIDTQVAAALVGFTPQVSLRDLLAETIGIELDKSLTRTDWAKRPIADAALHYALDDVRHLLDLWRHLETRLAALGRLEWLEEDAARLVAAPPVTDAETLWARLRGLSRLDERARRSALALIRWREAEAQRLDRPRRWILGDEIVMEIARRDPRTPAELAAIPELPKRLAARAGTEILAALRDAGADGSSLPAMPPRTEPADKARVKSLQSLVGERARELDLHAEILATRRDLVRVAAGQPPDYLATGWRAAELAEALGADP